MSLVEGILPIKVLVTLSCLRVLELPDICFGCHNQVITILYLIVNSATSKKREIGVIFYLFTYFSVPTSDEINLLDNALKKPRMAKMHTKEDIISNLPSDIIDNILIFFPIHEAAKTSILAMKWRFKWRYLSKLVFDSTFYERSILPSTPTTQPNISTLFLNIFRVLLLHHGPIFKFTFYVPLLKNCPEINQLFLYLIEKDVREISFYIESRPTFFRLPLFMPSCVTLRRLTLSTCSIIVKLAFQGFVNLISLKLQQVYFEANIFETFISKCPLLEALTVKKCSNIGNLDINLPYLKFFYFDGSCKTICFGKISQCLSTVIFDGYFNCADTSAMTKLFECLPTVEHLCLGYCFFKCVVGKLRRKLYLGCLRILELPEISFRHAAESSTVLTLIMSSHNLEKLEIWVIFYSFTCFIICLSCYIFPIKN
ncbi:F-box/FBD/LRR-repeat protein At1g13570-like [Mercurialis annua]|uniref:F-box/FBD/LRR-repeat protein At1g13570-like n=1 Tax=Mercurialis annua TaxID=3986 RepID=UPI0024ACC1FD|nr:F-box/FBD/LRR-repeat protein At1g13570-like [Mercurialis annua]